MIQGVCVCVCVCVNIQWILIFGPCALPPLNATMRFSTITKVRTLVRIVFLFEIPLPHFSMLRKKNLVSFKIYIYFFWSLLDWLGIEDIDVEDGVQPNSPCPYCYMELDIISLCLHLEDEHLHEARSCLFGIDLCSKSIARSCLFHLFLRQSLNKVKIYTFPFLLVTFIHMHNNGSQCRSK